MIELLLAVAIAGVVVALVYSIYHTVTRVADSQRERRDGAGAALRAVDTLARDLACTFVTGDDAECSFALKTATPEAADLSFCTAVLPAQEADPRWCVIERVAYRVAPAPGRRRALVRESRPVAGPGSSGPPATNLLVAAVASFRIELFDGETWSAEWPGESSGPCPRAARIEIGLADGGPTYRTEVFIPVGNAITSSLVRAGSQ